MIRLGINALVATYCVLAGLGVGLVVGFAGAIWALEGDRGEC